MHEKILQYGEGRFLRGFIECFFQTLNDDTDFEGSIVIVQPRRNGHCGDLEKVGCRYTHAARGLKDGVVICLEQDINIISRCINPYEDYGEYLKLADNPELRYIISNTTEAGIAYNGSDKLGSTPQDSFPARITALLYRRFTTGGRGFVFLPCELIENNAGELKKLIFRYGEEWSLGQDFIRWVEEQCIFCNTLVDRIVTGYPQGEDIPPEKDNPFYNTSELYHLWVIENGEQLGKELPFDKTNLNIIFTDNLDRYRTQKVRILNGAHTAMVPYALLKGVETVGECMEDEEISSFVRRCVYDEIIPSLDMPAQELVKYADSVFERFKNPYIHHQCSAIALNSVSKFKVRVLPSILAYIKKYNKIPKNLIYSLFCLIRFYRSGKADDDQKLIEYINSCCRRDILANTDLWGEDISFLEPEVTKYDN